MTSPNVSKLEAIGLGYAGLSLTVKFAKSRSAVGFDIDSNRFAALRAGHDSTLEASHEEQKRILWAYTTLAAGHSGAPAQPNGYGRTAARIVALLTA